VVAFGGVGDLLGDLLGVSMVARLTDRARVGEPGGIDAHSRWDAGTLTTPGHSRWPAHPRDKTPMPRCRCAAAGHSRWAGEADQDGSCSPCHQADASLSARHFDSAGVRSPMLDAESR
jgi:hypothetical protein